ncbi:CLIP-associated protein [Arachis hypogaea]|nr:CLIP-associated protein [Arachis hypogaea]
MVILTVVLEVLDDSDSSVKELVLSMLVEMLKNQKDVMESSVNIVIEKLLNVIKDRVPKSTVFVTGNANGTVFVTGSSNNLARVWNACKPSVDDTEQPNHEIDVLSGHENDVNYVQFSGCALASLFFTSRPVRHLASVAMQRSYPREMEYLFMLEH